jgi:hypothetical protein
MFGLSFLSARAVMGWTSSRVQMHACQNLGLPRTYVASTLIDSQATAEGPSFDFGSPIFVNTAWCAPGLGTVASLLLSSRLFQFCPCYFYCAESWNSLSATEFHGVGLE